MIKLFVGAAVIFEIERKSSFGSDTLYKNVKVIPVYIRAADLSKANKQVIDNLKLSFTEYRLHLLEVPNDYIVDHFLEQELSN